MTQLLYERIIKRGTVNEPKGKPEPQYALPATVNWMRALRIVCKHENISFVNARSAYLAKGSGKRSLPELAVNSIYEQLFLALHHLSALSAMRSMPNAADISRLSILGWYYGVYNLASAAICARDGSIQETHEGTARQWYSQIVQNGLSLHPFDTDVPSLVKADAQTVIKSASNYGKGTLKSTPTDLEQAEGALLEYTSGSVSWYRWKNEEKVKRSKEFKALGVNNFRTKCAQQLRDDRLSKRSLGFLHQAFRYRGKANYREALFLSYGASTNTILGQYADDLYQVLCAFVAMGGAYCSVSLGKDNWNAFVKDVRNHAAFSMPGTNVWSTI